MEVAHNGANDENQLLQILCLTLRAYFFDAV